jgi:DNA-binding XRE family transcriptional regulator
MGKRSTRENKNIYQRSRESCSLSREAAAELLVHLSPERIEKIESGRSAPHPDEVLAMEQSYRNVEPGELLIEEVYFTGSPIEGSTSPSMDQYIKLTNNSDRVVYADGVLFVTNFITGTITSVGAYYEYPELEDGLAVNNMYAIPGKGDEHPLAPGESLILALAAIDYTASYQDGDNVIEGNSNAIDLSRAHFEFYDENDIYPDTDNPDVENLDIWFKTSRTITSLHNRGFESYAIVIPPYDETAETIMTNHHWEGSYFFHCNE